MDEVKVGTLTILLIISVISDLKLRKIPNRVTGLGILSGFILFTFDAGLLGLLMSSLGLMTGIVIFIIPFAMGGMGAGDVKMLGAIGAIMGARFVFNTALFAAVSGGVIAIIYLVYKVGFVGAVMKLFNPLLTKVFSSLHSRTGGIWFGEKSNQLRSLSVSSEEYFIPYAVPISIGALIACFGFVF